MGKVDIGAVYVRTVGAAVDLNTIATNGKAALPRNLSNITLIDKSLNVQQDCLPQARIRISKNVEQILKYF